jgi:hypothetical protein
MRFRLAIAALALIIPLGETHAQNWYWWCDASNAGYPWVRTCATPWRLVVPSFPTPELQAPRQRPTPLTPNLNDTASQSATSEPIAATPLSPPSSKAFQDGQADRQAWEAWFNSQSGDYRAGAEYWAGHRSLRNLGSRTASPPSTGASWTAGCLAAQEKLTPLDTRRKTEPEYRLGWNNPGPLSSLPVATENAGTPGAQGKVGPLGATEVAPTSSASQPPVPQQPSSAASSAPMPVASHSSTENNAPIRPQSSNNDWIIAAANSLSVAADGWPAR